MDRPKARSFPEKTHIDQYPQGTCFESGHLVTTNAGWRTERPVIDNEKCVNCLKCYIACPEGCIFRTENAVDIDYDYCKGCGICARECKPEAIHMEREGNEK